MQSKVKIYPGSRIERIDQLHQNEVPFRAYEVLVQRIKAAIADEHEEQTCVIVHNSGGPEAWYIHTLSQVEQLEHDVSNMAAILSRVTAMLPRDDEAMTAEQVSALRNALMR